MNIVVKASNLAGVKEEIPQNNKDDIWELITTKYRNLTFEEIEYAFKMERFGDLPPRSEHFQIFGAEYVSKILDKFKEWRRGKRVDSDAPIALVEKTPLTTEQEKQALMCANMLNYWEEHNTKNPLSEGSHTVFDRLVEKELIGSPDNPLHKKYYQRRMSEAKKQLIEELRNSGTAGRVFKSKMKSYVSGISGSIESRAKSNIVKDYFTKLSENNICFKQILKEKFGYNE